MRTVTLLSALWLVVALPAQAAPPDATPATSQDAHAQTSVSHNRIGQIMGSLTQALREAAEQRQAQTQTQHTAQVDSLDKATTVQTSATSLPPDANAQAAVP